MTGQPPVLSADCNGPRTRAGVEWLPLVLLLSACAGAPPEDAVVIELDGIDEQLDEPLAAQLGPADTYFVYSQSLRTTHTAVVVSGPEHACGTGATEGEGTFLFFNFFRDPTASDARVLEPGEFEVWKPQPWEDEVPSGRRVVIKHEVREGSGSAARYFDSGTVTITAVSDEHLAATFDVTGSKTRLTGHFDAESCEDPIPDANF